MAVIQPRPTHILYQFAKCGDDRTSFSVHCEGVAVPAKQQLCTAVLVSPGTA